VLQNLEQNAPKKLVLKCKTVFDDIMIFDAETAEEFLQEEFNRRVRLNSRYSLRAFARLLGISSGSISEILKKQRPISLKNASKIIKALSLTTVEGRKFIELVQIARIDKNDVVTQNVSTVAFNIKKKNLDQDTFALVSEWQNFALLNLLDCEGFQWKRKYIAQRLGITVYQAKFAMDLLIRLGLVIKRNGQINGAENYVLSPSGISSQAIRKYHRQIIEKSIEAIDFQGVEERDFSGVGFAINPTHLPQIKKEISAFQDQLVAKYSKGKKQEVYFLETILFKLTKGK